MYSRFGDGSDKFYGGFGPPQGPTYNPWSQPSAPTGHDLSGLMGSIYGGGSYSRPGAFGGGPQSYGNVADYARPGAFGGGPPSQGSGSDAPPPMIRPAWLPPPRTSGQMWHTGPIQNPWNIRPGMGPSQPSPYSPGMGGNNYA